ncbi:MAG: LacI family DNA-binding transcriptional regulator, partial [bacterium]
MVKARLADVARKAGVTAATVSLVVSGNERISPATKQKVLKAVKELNYRPNSAARSLAAGKTNIIGVTAISFQAWYEMTLMKGMENRIYDTNYTLQQYPSGGYKEREKNILLDCIYAQKADTLIGMSYRPGPAGMKEIKKTSYPFVSLGEKIKGIPSVYFDDFKGGYLAGRHFVKTGKRKPAIIIQKQVKGFETSDMAGRLRGFA